MAKLILFVLPLGLDTFAVAAALGVAGLPARERLKISALMSGFELTMPIIGLLLGRGLGSAIGSAADYAAVAILFSLGVYMLAGDEGDEAERVASLVGNSGVALLGASSSPTRSSSTSRSSTIAAADTPLSGCEHRLNMNNYKQWRPPESKKAAPPNQGYSGGSTEPGVQRSSTKPRALHSGNASLNSSDYQAWADYFVKWINAYQSNGVPIWGITPQNEPLYCPTNYPGSSWDPASEANWVHNYLLPDLRNNSLSPKVIGFDHNLDALYFPQQLDTSQAAGDFSSMAWHCYDNNSEPTMIAAVHNQYGGDQYETECSSDSSPTDIIPLMVAVRDGWPTDIDGAGLPELRIERLDDDTSHQAVAADAPCSAVLGARAEALGSCLHGECRRGSEAGEPGTADLVDAVTVGASDIGLDPDRPEALRRCSLGSHFCVRNRRLGPEHCLPAAMGVRANGAMYALPDAKWPQRRRQFTARACGQAGGCATGTDCGDTDRDSRRGCRGPCRHYRPRPLHLALRPQSPSLEGSHTSNVAGVSLGIKTGAG